MQILCSIKNVSLNPRTFSHEIVVITNEIKLFPACLSQKKDMDILMEKFATIKSVVKHSSGALDSFLVILALLCLDKNTIKVHANWPHTLRGGWYAWIQNLKWLGESVLSCYKKSKSKSDTRSTSIYYLVIHIRNKRIFHSSDPRKMLFMAMGYVYSSLKAFLVSIGHWDVWSLVK